jgi:hypothetical protein
MTCRGACKSPDSAPAPTAICASAGPAFAYSRIRGAFLARFVRVYVTVVTVARAPE